MIILPTKGNLTGLLHYMEADKAQGGTLPHIVIMESDDRSYDGVIFPAHWGMRRYSGGKGAATHFNMLFQEFPDQEYYAYVGDDCVPMTEWWDIKLASFACRFGYAYPDDGHNGKWFAPHAFMSGDFVRRQGSLNPLGFDHYGFDNYWFHLAKTSKRAIYCPDVKLEHRQEHRRYAPDTKWQTFKNSKEWHEAVCKAAS